MRNEAAASSGKEFLLQQQRSQLSSNVGSRGDASDPIELDDSSSSDSENSAVEAENQHAGELNENNGFEEREIGFLKDHCWKCHEWIQHPDSTVDENIFEEVCYYALHMHPLLGVPVCCVCAEEIQSVESIRATNKSKTAAVAVMDNGNEEERMIESEVCSGCGRKEGRLLECEDCNRSLCVICLRQAHYGVDPPARTLFSKPWKCFCSPCVRDEAREGLLPSHLKLLQEHTEGLFSSGKDNKSIEKGSKQYHKKLTETLDILHTLEVKKRECESKLEDPDRLLQTIQEDIENDDIHGTGKKLEEEIQRIYQQWIHHEVRIQDRMNILGDRLKADFDIELKAAIKYVMDYDCDSNARDGDDEDDEPEWKRKADRTLAKNEKAKRKRYRKEDNRSDDHPKYRLVLTDDAEDLGSECSDHRPFVGSGQPGESDSDEDNLMNLGWRHMPARARKEEIEEAQKEEDRNRILQGKTTLIVRRKEVDDEERQKWDAGLKTERQSRKRVSPRRIITVPNTDDVAFHEPNIATARYDRPAFQRRNRASFSPQRKSNSGFPFASLSEKPDTMDIQTLVRTPETATNWMSGFKPSSLILSQNPLITVDKRIERQLKEHQREGIRFMFRNAFSDLGNDSEDANNSNSEDAIPLGGCILAHSMGLGKSLSCVALLHTVMGHPSLFDSNSGRGKIHKVMLVVPVNTIANWENEFCKWMHGLRNKLTIFNLSEAETCNRQRVVEYWSKEGGVLLTTDALFRNMVKREKIEALLTKSDAIVLDESHTMLKNKDNLVYKAFMKIETKRRICLTGTPFQNNLLEYYLMISYIRPNLLGDSQREFQREYADPIQEGMGTDAAEEVKVIADRQLQKLFDALKPYIHRRDSTLLCKDLPSLQQVCLHIRPTKVQRALYRAYQKHRRVTNDNNFLKQFSAMRPIHNHPGTVLVKNSSTQTSSNKRGPSQAEERSLPLKREPAIIESRPKSSDDAGKDTKEKSGRSSPDSIIEILSSDEEPEKDEADDDDVYRNQDNPNNVTEWWAEVVNKFGPNVLKQVQSGNKCIILLHILAHAHTLGEKTVLFSQSLKTLDFLSDLLKSPDWQNLCPSLKAAFPDLSIGGWVQGTDFLRIDGATSGIARGELLKDFSDRKSLRLFLISSKAGGIGINLVSANRVILFDSHFNPTIDLQAIYRCYRYGQTRNVFAYRLLTQGSIEENVYSRAVTKIGLGNRIVDGKELRRCFKKDEIESLARNYDWVQCTRCNSWRMFPPDHSADMNAIHDDDNWFCEKMDEHDKRMKLTCEFPEQETTWYVDHFKKPNETIVSGGDNGITRVFNQEQHHISDADCERLVARDKILQNLLTISSASKKSSQIVTKHYFHDTLLSEAESLGDGNEEETSNDASDSVMRRDAASSFSEGKQDSESNKKKMSDDTETHKSAMTGGSTASGRVRNPKRKMKENTKIASKAKRSAKDPKTTPIENGFEIFGSDENELKF